MFDNTLFVPMAQLCVANDDAAAAAERRRIAEMLRNGEPVTINSDGVMHTPERSATSSPNMSGAGHVVQGDVELVVPTGKLAVR